MQDIRQMALAEYNSDVTTAHHGTIAGGIFWSAKGAVHDGIASRPFWNVHATQFMYNPCFEFNAIPGCTRYLFTATDCNKKVHTFEANSPMSLLTPIWGDLPEGYVELKVEALEEDGTPWSLAGARTFYRCAPFQGPGYYPPKARSYRESALMAYRYIYNLPAVQHWLTCGTLDPTYDLNVYPSKMIAAIIGAMISYAALEPEQAQNALQLARNAADYLISISIGKESPLAGLPPTYYTDFRPVTEDTDNATANEHKANVMMLYPAEVGYQYVCLAEATGDSRYLDAARAIANYFRDNVLENGTWHLMVSIATGKSVSVNDCVPRDVITFLRKMYAHTGEEIWKTLSDNAHAYQVRNCMDSYNWEGQFEDSPTSAHYSNLANSFAGSMVCYIAENQKDDPAAIAQAEDLMRFVEDQFVVWGKHAPRNRWKTLPWCSSDKADWHSPAALEQYNWYMPIDASTAGVMYTFLQLYKANGNPVLLAKACALADSITNIQNPVTGMIPTHWMSKTCMEDGGSFWINCMIHTANCMMVMAKETETEI